MRRTKFDEAKLAERRRQVAALYTRKVRQEEIAQRLGVDQATVSRDVKHLKQQWREEAMADVGDRIGQELAELEEMERDCMRQYAATRAAKWLEVRLDIKKRIAALLGLDKPVKLAPTDPTGEKEYVGRSDAELAAELAAILDAARARQGGEDPPGVGE